jgi:hypothetical protein
MVNIGSGNAKLKQFDLPALNFLVSPVDLELSNVLARC